MGWVTTLPKLPAVKMPRICKSTPRPTWLKDMVKRKATRAEACSSGRSLLTERVAATRYPGSRKRCSTAGASSGTLRTSEDCESGLLAGSGIAPGLREAKADQSSFKIPTDVKAEHRTPKVSEILVARTSLSDWLHCEACYGRDALSQALWRPFWELLYLSTLRRLLSSVARKGSTW